MSDTMGEQPPVVEQTTDPVTVDPPINREFIVGPGGIDYGAGQYAVPGSPRFRSPHQCRPMAARVRAHHRPGRTRCR